MKHLKTYKLFESVETIEFLVEDLFGVDPQHLRDVMTSLLDELEVAQFEIRYSMRQLGQLKMNLVNNGDFSWQYELFIDNEKGLNKVDYDMFDRFRTNNNIPYDKFSASINIICYKQHNNNFDELGDIIEFINNELPEYGIKLKADKKFSGFLSPDFFGNTGYMIQLVNENIIE